ncbi:hypothetical protein BRC86_13860 [Halobacteriales archaeon QS_3_64_16]|nr:MAG: hypothetical protein BRC86_13860 [Halobacteriales archaeon QS_3_64_16]
MSDVVTTESVLDGTPRLDGHRISALQIADMVVDSARTPEYVADQLDLSLANTHEPLAYYYRHPDEMDALRAKDEALKAELDELSNAPHKQT